ncbi:hypothetical protein ACHAWT_006660 [Skeletonema menzelii]
MRQRRWATAPTRPRYSQLPASSAEQLTPLNRYFPSVIILASFLSGWLLGRHESTRNTAVKLTLQSSNHVKNIGNAMISKMSASSSTFEEQCETSDGNGNVAFCSVAELFGKLVKERIRLGQQMTTMSEYGTYYNQIFSDMNTKAFSFPAVVKGKIKQSIQRQKKQNHLFLSSIRSMKRLTRRIMIKHLEAAMRKENSPPPVFTWMTAGDSSAAGHGNLYSQSYTAVLQRTVQAHFKAVGIQFEAKNYGMGNYNSAPELALCMNEIFGDDIDVLMWDFASLQPSSEPVRKSVLWAHRAGIHPTRPILFSYDSFGERFLKLQEFDGIGSVMMDADALQSIRQGIPDSNSVAEPMHDLPEAIRYYRCGQSIEGGVACDDSMRNFVCYADENIADDVALDLNLCRMKKFDTKPCIDARFQVSWHPGVKDQKLKGHLLGHFLITVLDDAIIELEQLKALRGYDPGTLLKHLIQLEDKDRRSFQRKFLGKDYWNIKGMDWKVLLRGESICHTALLPSKSRLQGLTTESDLVGDEFGNFDTGFNQFLMKAPEGVLPLAYDMNDRQHCQLLEVNHKDFFLVREQDGWVSTLVPNDRELEVYKRSTPPEGIIMVCLKLCPLNKCPDAYVSIDEISRNTRLFINVDGKPVTDVRKVDNCNILVGDHGIRWGRKDQFQLDFHINGPGNLYVLKVSSIIVF